MNLRKAAEQALEALMQKGEHHPKVYQAAEALRQALAQPEQEPVAWVIEDGEVDYYVDVVAKIKPGTPLYTAPPKREWVGLSDEEREHFRKLGFVGVLAVENKLKEKNT